MTNDPARGPRDLDADGLPRLPALPGLPDAAVDSVPGLARVAASAAWHTGQWGVRTTARGWLRVGRAVTDRDEARELAREVARDVGTVVGVVGEVARQVAEGKPVSSALLEAGEALGGTSQHPAANGQHVVGGQVVEVVGVGGATGARPVTLRERGAQLLERSRDVWSTDDRHPAYDRILDELAPDEARILVMLLRDGPQPSVDVRTGGPIGMVSSQLIAPGLNMLGPRAGARYLDQVPAYVNNLFRLGLIWLSREPLPEHQEYQVLEAQPDVLAALHAVRFAKVVRRSIHLTPFGEQFVKLALVDEEEAASPDLPEHATPPEDATGG